MPSRTWLRVHIDHNLVPAYGHIDHTHGSTPMPRPDLPARIAGLHSRDDYLALVGLKLEAFNSLRRRDQLPQRPPYEMSEQLADARGFGASSALALIIAVNLADRYGLSRERAAQIAGGVNRAQSCWSEISATSKQVADGETADFDVLYASVDLPGVKPTKKLSDPTIAVGTINEIAAEHPTATGIIAVSVTRCAALMRQRAARAKIDLAEFWETFR